MNYSNLEFKKINNSSLNEKIKTLAQQERKLTKEIIEHLAEIDRRKLFLDFAYPSLFEYMLREVGYSAGAAQRRIDAARLSQQIPEVSMRLEDGSLNLNHISKFQKMCRQLKADTGTRINVAKKRDILQKIENKTTQETERILSSEFGFKIQTNEKQRVQADESTKVELIFTKEEMQLIEAAKQLLSHSAGGKLKETILKLAQLAIDKSKSNSTLAAGKSKPTDTLAFDKSKATATVAVVRSTNRVTPKIRQFILNRDQVCQYKNHNTQQICGSKFYLEVDHIQPRYAGGANSPSNLRALCKNHNIYRYQIGR